MGLCHRPQLLLLPARRVGGTVCWDRSWDKGEDPRQQQQQQQEEVQQAAPFVSVSQPSPLSAPTYRGLGWPMWPRQVQVVQGHPRCHSCRLHTLFLLLLVPPQLSLLLPWLALA